MDHISSSQWSHVSDSCLPNGPNSTINPAFMAACHLKAGSGSKRNVPFISSVRLTPNCCQLVVDLGRTFGPIPLLQESQVIGKGMGHKNLALANDAHVSNSTDSATRPAPLYSGLLQAGSSLPTTSQQVITKLGERGRIMGAPSTVPSCSSVRSGKGVSLRNKRSGITVKAAREAVFREPTMVTTQKDLLLLQEATTTWDLGKVLGLRAPLSDAEVVEKIYEMEVRDTRKGSPC
ncbi:hypothetical protein Dimus_027183 [Dionaea muscipula]